MRSRIYNAQVMHARISPARHHFVYPVYIFAFDLDELEQLDKEVKGFGYNRFAPSSIYDRDYLNHEEESIKTKLLQYLKEKSCDDGITRIECVTSARYFNYVFNPVSFYYCYREDGSLRCAVAEVNNTFRERHLYILDAPQNSDNGYPFRYLVPKDFYVSPFFSVEGDYDFYFNELGDKLDIRIDVRKDSSPLFKSRIWGKALPLTSSDLFKTLLRQPLTAWLTMPRILWQAAKLHYRKRLPVYKKPNPTSSMTIATAPPATMERFYLSLIKKYFDTCTNGYLSMHLPNGDTLAFGNVNDPHHAFIEVHSYNFFKRLVYSGDIGLGESYMAKEWSSTDLIKVFLFFTDNYAQLKNFTLGSALLGHITNRAHNILRKNTLRGSKKNIHDHYDLSNEFFATLLDPTMTYSCAIFEKENMGLEDAQRAKLQTIIKKANITAADHVLEIGTGWGSFAIEAVQNTGCKVTTITLSEEQKKLAMSRVREAGLQDHIDIQLCDYRQVSGTYDKIVSIEMIEAVGHEYLNTYFQQIDRLLKPDGVVLLQAIAIPNQRYKQYRKDGDWIQKHIFPGALVPSLQVMIDALSSTASLGLHRLDDYGPHYAKTLAEWRITLLQRQKIFHAMGYDERFMRTWDYYLAYCQAGFASGFLHLYHLLLHRPSHIRRSNTL